MTITCNIKYNEFYTDNNMTRNTYKIPLIRSSFQNSYLTLTKCCYDDFDDGTR